MKDEELGANSFVPSFSSKHLVVCFSVCQVLACKDETHRALPLSICHFQHEGHHIWYKRSEQKEVKLRYTIRGGFRKQQCFSGWVVDQWRRTGSWKEGKGKAIRQNRNKPLGQNQS